MHGKQRRLNGPYRALLILEELGGVYLKFGQIFAMRLDLIPMRYASVLMNLFSNVTAQPNYLFFEAFERAPRGKNWGSVSGISIPILSVPHHLRRFIRAF